MLRRYALDFSSNLPHTRGKLHPQLVPSTLTASWCHVFAFSSTLLHALHPTPLFLNYFGHMLLMLCSGFSQVMCHTFLMLCCYLYRLTRENALSKKVWTQFYLYLYVVIISNRSLFWPLEFFCRKVKKGMSKSAFTLQEIQSEAPSRLICSATLCTWFQITTTLSFGKKNGLLWLVVPYTPNALEHVITPCFWNAGGKKRGLGGSRTQKQLVTHHSLHVFWSERG